MYKIHNPANAGGSIDDCNSQPTPASNCSVMTQYTYDVDRPTNEIKHVTAVNTSTNTVTFDSPVTISYRVSHTAWLSSWATPFLQQAGVENLTMNNADDDEIDVNQCAYCWLYKVEVTNWLGRGIDLLGAFRTQLDTLYVHEGAWCVPGGGGYNIGIDYASSEVYVVNSISNRCNKVIVDRAAGAGSVVAYNFMDDGYIAGTPGWIEIGANASHLIGSRHVLFEGNKAFNWDSDSTHGSAIYMTSFRNQYSGIRESFTSNIDGITRTDSCNGSTTAPMRAIGAHIYTWWSSWLYNDLGTPGCTLPANGWTLNGTQTSGHPVMYLLGADDEESNYAGDPNIQTIYPAVGPNCNASAPNCSSIISGNWLLGWTNTIAGTAWNTGNVSSGITLSTTNTTNDTATMTLSSGPQLAYSNDIVTESRSSSTSS